MKLWGVRSVKKWMGHSGPRTEEKWRMRGMRVVMGRVSMMAATFCDIDIDVDADVDVDVDVDGDCEAGWFGMRDWKPQIVRRRRVERRM